MREILPGLFLIDLDLPLPGFRNFVSCWLWQKGGNTILVDPGPLSTVPHLLRELKHAQVQKIDYILLTHIHIDHAGGVGRLAEYFPQAQICCHPKGIPHLIDPEKLWQGSLKVLGTLARTYGPIVPVPEGRLFFSPEIGLNGTHIEVLETPGHAAHHLSYRLGETLFVGEAAGVRIKWKDRLYTRPATPPKFIYEIYRHSLERLLPYSSLNLCFAHYGCQSGEADFFRNALNQLDLWLKILKEALKAGISDASILTERLLERDDRLKSFFAMPKDIQERERYFIANSIRGMVGYLQNV